MPLPPQHAAIRANILQDIHKQYILWQALKALKYMHSAELLHRDMKPSNLLLNSDCLMKVADFGLARSLKEAERTAESESPPLTDYVATRWYRAPEILLGSNRYMFAVDMWSVGCILGEMILVRLVHTKSGRYALAKSSGLERRLPPSQGKPIFPGSSTMNQLEKIMELTGKPGNETLTKISSYATSLCNQIQIMPTSLGAPDIRERWRARLPRETSDCAVDLLVNLLHFDPSMRLTAAEALDHSYVAQFHDPNVERDAPRPVKVRAVSRPHSGLPHAFPPIGRSNTGVLMRARYDPTHNPVHILTSELLSPTAAAGADRRQRQEAHE